MNRSSEVGGEEDVLDTYHVTGYSTCMIAGFKHRGLRKFFEKGDPRGLHANHLPKIRRLLARLHAATDIRDLAAPGHRLHPLKGPRVGEWAIDVDGNRRITCRIEGRDCHDVGYEYYH